MIENAVVDLLDLDELILHDRMYSGMSIRRLSRKHGISEDQVLKALDRVLPPLSPETRVRIFREDLHRLDEMLAAHYPAARTGSSSSAMTCLRILERRSAMVGHDSPLRVDVLLQPKADAPSSTEQLLLELQRIVDERTPEPALIEGANRRGDPSYSRFGKFRVPFASQHRARTNVRIVGPLRRRA
jgi:hypothetical protein